MPKPNRKMLSVSMNPIDWDVIDTCKCLLKPTFGRVSTAFVVRTLLQQGLQRLKEQGAIHIPFVEEKPDAS